MSLEKGLVDEVYVNLVLIFRRPYYKEWPEWLVRQRTENSHLYWQAWKYSEFAGRLHFERWYYNEMTSIRNLVFSFFSEMVKDMFLLGHKRTLTPSLMPFVVTCLQFSPPCATKFFKKQQQKWTAFFSDYQTLPLKGGVCLTDQDFRKSFGF